MVALFEDDAAAALAARSTDVRVGAGPGFGTGTVPEPEPEDVVVVREEERLCGIAVAGLAAGCGRVAGAAAETEREDPTRG